MTLAISIVRVVYCISVLLGVVRYPSTNGLTFGGMSMDDANDGSAVPSRTGRILVPIAEQNRREVHQAAHEIVTGLYAATINDTDPIRYDPPEHGTRAPAEPMFFFTTRTSRVVHRRPSFARWGRK